MDPIDTAKLMDSVSTIDMSCITLQFGKPVSEKVKSTYAPTIDTTKSIDRKHYKQCTPTPEPILLPDGRYLYNYPHVTSFTQKQKPKKKIDRGEFLRSMGYSVVNSF